MQPGMIGVTGAMWSSVGQSHSIADIALQNPNPLEGKLFQLPELLLFTMHLVHSHLPGAKHDPLSPRALVTPPLPPQNFFSLTCVLANHALLKPDTLRPDLSIAKETAPAH